MSIGVLPALAILLTACNASGGAADGATAAESNARGPAPAADSAAVAGSAGRTAARPSDPLLARADSARVRGSSEATVWIVEISDFQCPFCRQWHEETYRELLREYVATGKAKLAYVNFPLPNHPHAREAAEAAMCAGAQAKFWPMHDALFTSQPRWAAQSDPTSTFDSLASAVGAQMADYRACVSGGAMRALVQADFERAEAAGVGSTPTFIIDNAVRLEGAHPIAAFRAALDSVLAARQKPDTI